MLLDCFLEKMKELGIKNVVMEDDLIEIIPNLERCQFEIDLVSDVRSATFFACGKAEISDSPVLLIVKNDFISNCYTGLVESWFQRRKIIVLSIGTNIVNKDFGYLSNCSEAIWKIQNQNDIFDFFNCCNFAQSKPYVFVIEDSISPVSKEIPLIKRTSFDFSVFDTIFIYNSFRTSFLDNEDRIRIIYDNEKYCVFSKFIGFVTAKNKPCLIIVPSSFVNYDLNIFNNRYSNKNIKIILKVDSDEQIIQNWVCSNGFKVFKTDNEAGFIGCDKPSVLLIK